MAGFILLKIRHCFTRQLPLKNDKIISIGSNHKIETFIDHTTFIVDLEGKTVIPGFIDSHAHFMNLGYLKLNLDLNQTKSWPEILDMVANAVKSAKSGVWIEGRGWHQEKWKELPKSIVEGYPIHKELTAISLNNPVYLQTCQWPCYSSKSTSHGPCWS